LPSELDNPIALKLAGQRTGRGH